MKKDMIPKTKKTEEIELVPDAWERFEKAVATVAKSGPKHRPAKPRNASQNGALAGKDRVPKKGA
jgi:hypothetical protein